MDEPSARKIMSQLGITVLGKSDAGWLQARCPLAPWTHEKGTDRRPGFGILVNDAGRSSYKCLACHHKGRVADLCRTLGEYRRRDFRALAADADRADMAGAFGNAFDNIQAMISSEFEEPEPVDENAIAGIYPPAFDVPEAAAYLGTRGIGQEAAELMGLCYDPDDYRVMFPVRGRRGELYGFTGRSILREEVYPYARYPKVRDYLGLPKRLLLLGAELFQPGKPSFVIEGLIGYASLIEQGVREIVNPLCLMGSEMTIQKAYQLSDIGENAYLMLDNDAGGESGLFGKVRPDGSVDERDGAVARLRAKDMIVFVPEWPLWPETVEHNGKVHYQNEPKIDPDELSFEDVAYILEHCAPWAG